MKSQHAGLCVEETKECELALPHSSEVGRTLTLLLPELFGWPRGGHTGLRRFRTKRRGNSNWFSISLVELHNNFFYRFQKKNDETQECAYFCRVNARARTENMEKDSKLRLQITAVSHPAKKKEKTWSMRRMQERDSRSWKKRRKKPAEIRTISRFPISS